MANYDTTDWRTRVQELSRQGSWTDAIGILEQVGTELRSPEEHAEAFRERARILDDVLLRRVEAAAVYGQVVEIDPGRIDALRRARFIHRSVGAMRKVATSIEHELGSVTEPSLAADLLVDLGDTFQDLGDDARALASYRRALELVSDHEGARNAIDDIETHDPHERMQVLGKAAKGQADARGAHLLLRAARIARRAGDERYQPLLEAAVRRAPLDPDVGTLLDTAYASSGQLPGLLALQLQLVTGIDDVRQRARVATELAARWMNRFQDQGAAKTLLEAAASADPSAPAPAAVLGRSSSPAPAPAAPANGNGKGPQGLAAPSESSTFSSSQTSQEASVSEQEDITGTGEVEQPPAARELTAADQKKLAELDEALAKFEAQKRWSDVIKTILAKAEIVVDPAQKVDLYSQAGAMYLEKSSNQAEAIKCYESVLEHDHSNVEAITRLKEMYEKRRDWERLIKVMGREVEMLDEMDRPLRYIEMAQLATERLRKPEVCIDLWQKVLEYDAENPDALNQLAGLYERAREFGQLAKVLETRSAAITDREELKQALNKLGMIYADKLNDDAGAVRAFKRLLEIDPDDRRAQEQLKKRYTALKAWDELEAFYSTTDKWDELIRVYEREAEAKETPDAQKIDLFFRIARLWADKKQKTDRAAKSYEKVLELDPNNFDAAVALSPIYEAANNAKALAGVYEVRLRHVQDADERIQLLRETGLLYEERLKAPPTAFEKFLEAFAIDPAREIIREDVNRLAPAVNGWDRVIDAYTTAIAGAQSESDAIDLRVTFGHVLTQVGRVDDAIAQYRAVYDARSDHELALEALERLYRQTGRFKDLLEIYERRIELASDEQLRRRLEYERAGLYENELRDPNRAIEAYQSILSVYGDQEADAYRSLDRLFEQENRWSDFAATLERRIELGPETPEELAALKFRLARALELHLEDKPRALELHREVLSIVPEHDGARAALEAMLEERGLGVQAAEILEPLYEVREDWAMLIRANEVLLKGLTEPSESAERLALLTKIGETYATRVQNPAQAFEAFSRALREAPESEETLGRLEVIAVEQERFRDLVELVGSLAADATQPDLKRSLWIKAAQMYDVQLGDVDGAVSAYRKVLDQDPGDAEVLNALETLYTRTQRWRDLLGVLRRRAELATDPEAKEQILAQMARIHDEMLQEPAEAISVYKEILELDPASALALQALDQLFERQQMWSDLADNIERQLQMATDPEAQIAFMLRLADLRETRMNATDAAIEIYREVLERDPQQQAALGALERLITQPAHQVAIAEILEPIYRDANEYRKLIGVHEIQAQHASAPERRVELLHRVAELYEVALDEAENAFRSFARALAEDPANQQTQAELERIARGAGAYEPLAQVYEERVQSIEDPQLAATLYVKAAEIRENNLGDVENAIAHYRRVLELDNAHLDAATALERLYQMNERYEDLASIYLTKSKMLATPEEQKEYLFRGASIYEEILERPLSAVEIYHKVLEVDSEELRAIDKLIELYLRLEQWDKLLDVYTRKADIVHDPEEKKSLLVEVGAVYEREMGDVAKAIDIYQRILEIDPDDLTAIGRLDALYQASENWQELLSVLEREADLASDPSEVISYRYRIADLWEHRLGDATRAVDIYREILDVLPDHEPTLSALERMVAENREPVAAAGVLEPVYRQVGEWGKLIAVHEVQIAHETDPVRKVELLHAVGELYETQLDQARQAFEAYARAVPLDSGNDQTLANVERLAEQLGAWGEVTKLYDDEIEKLRQAQSERLVDHALRTAQIYEVQAGDVNNAIERYRIVLGADEVHAQAIEALDRLYEATERWGDLAEILKKEIQIAGSPDEVLNFQFRLGQTLQERLGEIDGAIEQYREILAAAPEHGPALGALETLFQDGIRPLQIAEILEPLYRMQETWDRLIGVMTVTLQHQAEPSERIAMMHKIAEIAEEKANDHQTAFEWQQRALLEEPTHDHTSAEVERLARVLDGWSELSSTYADVIEQTADPRVKVDVGKRLARTYENELGDIQRAEEAYRHVIAVDPRDGEALEALDRIYTEHGAHEAQVMILRKRIDAVEEKQDKVDLAYRLAQTLENDLGRIDEAVSVYRNILDSLDPEHADSIRALNGIYAEKQDWQSLYSTYEKELAVVGSDSAQAEIFAKMALLAAQQLNDLGKATELWRKVLDLRGEDPEALNAIGDIYARQENWRDLVDILEREVAIADEDEMRIAVYSDLGRIWYEKLGRERQALESWERVLDIDPSNTAALFAKARIYRDTQQWRELVDTLTRIIDVGAATLDDATLEDVYMQLGELYAIKLEQPMDAVDAYRKVLDINPRNFDAMDKLDVIHRAEGQWEDAIGVMEKRVEALEDPQQKIDVLLEIAKMWEDQVGDRDRGTSAYERILGADPLHEHAFKMIDELHTEAMRWEPLIEQYLARVENTQEPRDRVQLLRKIAKVYEEELRERDKAFDALQIAWTEDFHDKETRDQLERVAGLTNKWNELLSAANEALAQVTDSPTKIQICLACAKWYGVDLKRPEYAIPYYQQILALDPSNVAAMRQMAELYRITQQWQVLVQILTRLVDMTEDPVMKGEVYMELGLLHEQQLNVAEQAGRFYQAALQTDPDNVRALDRLEGFYREQQRWPELLDTIQRKQRALKEGEDWVRETLKIAELYEDRFGDADAAIEQYRAVTAQDPQNLDALKGLERLYAQKERWQDLLGVLEAELEVVQTEKERIAILLRLAGMWEEEFVKADKAAERLEQVVDIDPGHEAALGSLERIYRNLQKWDQLVATYERHVQTTPDRAEKIRLYKAVGEVWGTELGDQERAIDAYLNVTSLDDDDVEALDALTRLYEKRGDHSQALDTMGQLARLSQDPAQIVDLRYRMGRIMDEQLGDRQGAVDQYQAAVDVEPGHLPSLEAIRKIHIDNGDWLQASRVLEQETQYQQQPRIVARLLVELGQIYNERLEEHDRAIEVFEAAYKQNPDEEDAALPLVDEYFKQERFADALPMLQMLTKRAGKREAADQHRLFFMLGEAATKTNDDEEAVKAFTKAYQLDQTHLPTLMALAASYYRTKDWEKAFKFYQMLLVHHRDALGRDETTDIFYRLGVIKREQGERRKALNMFDKALEEDNTHRPTLEAVVGLYEQQNEWEQVIHFKKQILEIADIEERYALLDQIGDLWKEKLRNPTKAIQSYAEATELRPKDHKTLHKLLALYQETKQWEKAIEIIQRVSDLDERPAAKSKYAYTIGVIVRDELKNPDLAIEKMNEALDLDPDGMLKAFEAINKILTTKKDWKQLERAYRKMLKRVVGRGNKDLEFSLWHTLGIIYRDRQKEFEHAAEAFKMASQLQPDNAQEHQILAELFSIIPTRIDDAIAEHQWLLRQDPYRVDSYRALYKLYFDARSYDKAWCLASTLTFLKKADAEQQQFYEQYKAQGMIRPQSRLTEEKWLRDVYHPEEDLYAGKIFEQVAPAVHAIYAQDDKKAGLNKKHQVDQTSTVTFARTFFFVAQVLNLRFVPRLFLRPDLQGALLYVPSNPPSSVCGSSLLSGFNPQDLTFVVAKHLGLYRGEHFVRTMLPTHDQLKLVLLAALRLAGLGVADPAVDQTAQQLAGKLPPANATALREAAKKFVEQGAKTDVKRWMQTVELTSCRAGFLICNDLEIAARMIQAEPAGFPGDLPPKEKIKEIVLFSVSEQYFRLREALGIQINIG